MVKQLISHGFNMHPTPTPPPYPLPKSLARTGLYMNREHDAPPRLFQVLGERASGTNYVRKLIDLNVALLRTEGLGWKHAPPHSVGIPDNMVSVCVFRDARKWALSMHSRPWSSHPRLQSGDFAEFIRSPWEGIVDRVADFEEIHPEMQVQDSILQFDRHPITGAPYENLFALRRTKMEMLLGMMNRGCNVIFARFEAVMDDPVGFVTAIKQTYDVGPNKLVKDGQLRQPKRRMGNNFSSTVKDRPATPKDYPAEDMDFLRNTVAADLEGLLGYDYQ